MCCEKGTREEKIILAVFSPILSLKFVVLLSFIIISTQDFGEVHELNDSKCHLSSSKSYNITGENKILSYRIFT
jgi:hypothetical protein